MKSFRQGLILDLVGREAITSQEQLRKKLRGRGVEATQATLSRDIAELALVKHASDGAYRLPGTNGQPADPSAVLSTAVAEYVRGVERVRELVVIRTAPGQAGILGIAIDRASLDEVAGTVAGDDTLLVIVRDVRRARSFVRMIEGWARGL